MRTETPAVGVQGTVLSTGARYEPFQLLVRGGVGVGVLRAQMDSRRHGNASPSIDSPVSFSRQVSFTDIYDVIDICKPRQMTQADERVSRSGGIDSITLLSFRTNGA